MEVSKINRLTTIFYGDAAFDSGANPDFKVTSATRQAREMDRLLRSLSLQSETLDRKVKALSVLGKAREDASTGLSVADPVLIEDASIEPVKGQ